MNHLAIEVLARRLPKADLHLHFHGGLTPSTVHRIRHGRERTKLRDAADAIYDYRSGEKFFTDLEHIAGWMDTRELAREAALDVLAGAVDNGCRHVELMVTPETHRLHAGLDPLELLRAVGDAFTYARELWNLTGGILVEYHRPDGHIAAIDTLRVAVTARDAGIPIAGIGNDGSPYPVLFSELADSYEAARSEGFKLCGHVDTAQDVVDALAIGLDRLDHAFDLADNPAALAEVRDARTPVTMCITSNCIMLPQRFPTANEHPFERFRCEGVAVSLHTDDPPMFFTDLSQEYRSAATAYGWNPAQLADVADASLDAAWLDSVDADTIRDTWRRDSSALLADPYAPHRSIERTIT